jgi:hypothetical protein
LIEPSARVLGAVQVRSLSQSGRVLPKPAPSRLRATKVAGKRGARPFAAVAHKKAARDFHGRTTALTFLGTFSAFLSRTPIRCNSATKLGDRALLSDTAQPHRGRAIPVRLHCCDLPLSEIAISARSPIKATLQGCFLPWSEAHALPRARHGPGRSRIFHSVAFCE